MYLLLVTALQAQKVHGKLKLPDTLRSWRADGACAAGLTEAA